MAAAVQQANGHALPVSAWPQQDGPGQSRTAPDRPKRRALVMSAFRRNWWRPVFAAVGAVAAVVSYGHIVSLFLSWHASSLDAHLMPIAIDGLIVIGAGAAKSGQVWLGWSAIGPGLAASLYANVMNGLPHGRDAAMGSGWATVALFLATNVMERWKAAPAVIPRRDSDHDGTADDAIADGTGGGDDDGRPPSPEPSPSPSRSRQPKPSAKTARALAVMKRNPGLSPAQVAAKAGVSESTVTRARRDMNGAPK